MILLIGYKNGKRNWVRVIVNTDEITPPEGLKHQKHPIRTFYSNLNHFKKLLYRRDNL